MRCTRLLPLLSALLGTAAWAQTPPFEVELGYRFTDVQGDDRMYRTQVNERAGFLLRGVSLVDDYSGRTGAYDRLRLSVSDLGAGPAGAARLEVSRAGR
jgi:hypothetical protein